MGSHCDPETAEGSGDVHAYGKQAHRHNDKRKCPGPGRTKVKLQSTVRVNGRLWAVKGDPNDHGNGQLINNSGSTIRIEGHFVIVYPGDHAHEDNRCGEDI